MTRPTYTKQRGVEFKFKFVTKQRVLTALRELKDRDQILKEAAELICDSLKIILDESLNRWACFQTYGKQQG